MREGLSKKLKVAVSIDSELSEIKNIVNSDENNDSKFRHIKKIVVKISKEIEKARVDAMFDSRTGLLSAKFGEEVLIHEIELAKRTDGCFTAAFLDIDHLKYINDNFGHTTGTKVIIEIANLLKKRVRKLDFTCRYGGDEFLIIFPKTEIERAKKTIKRIKKEVGAMVFSESSVKVTMSVGISQYNPSSELTSVEFLDQVDRDLYEAKKKRVNVNLQ